MKLAPNGRSLCVAFRRGREREIERHGTAPKRRAARARRARVMRQVCRPLFRCASAGILSYPHGRGRPINWPPRTGHPHLFPQTIESPSVLCLPASLSPIVSSSKQAKLASFRAPRHGQGQAALGALAGRRPAPRRGEQTHTTSLANHSASRFVLP